MRYFLLFFFGLFFSSAFAQPNPKWFHMYENHEEEKIHDVYTLAVDGYVACGYTSLRGYYDLNSPMDVWVLRLDNAGQIVWSNTYGQENTREKSLSLIETDDGSFFIGGCQFTEGWSSNVLGILIDSDGNEIWLNTYGSGSCSAVIELKSGEYALTGYEGGERDGGFVACVNTDGDLLWRTFVQADEQYNSSILQCLRETDGGIIACGTFQIDDESDVWIVKIDFNGEVLWQRRIDSVADWQYCLSMASGHQDGFFLAGQAYFNNRNAQFYSDMFLLKINNIGETLWSRTYHLNGNFQANVYDMQKCWQLVKMENDFVLVGYAKYDNVCNPIAIQVDENGGEIWSALYNFSDDEEFGNSNQFFAGVNGHENSVIAGGTIYHNQSELPLNGFLMKLEPWSEHPTVFSYSPEDTVITVLQADSIEFSVSARDQQGDAIYYQWNYDDEEVSRDSLVTIHFPELGLHEVQCVVTDSANFVEIRWHITVDDFFITATTPDSLRLLTRRGSTLPFTMDVACVEPDEPTVEWTVVNRDNDREYIGEADTVEVSFDLAGDWAVQAEASWNGERESVRWVVDVRSAVWWWMPHEDAISVNRNDRQDFSVFAFNPDSDSLSIGWWMDGDSLESSAEVLTLDFPDIGEHALVSIVRNGVEADTITWAITVNASGVEPDRNGLPFELALHLPAPNPFNSTTTIGYSLPIAGNVSLAVYDLSGREVTRLVDGVKITGNHQVSWNANGVASGVYVVAMDTGGMMLREKVVLVK